MPSSLIPEQRRARLIALAQDSGAVSVRSAAEDLDVSAMTVRRDIAALEESGEIEIVSGGFRVPRFSRAPMSRTGRSGIATAEKAAVAAIAAALVSPGDVVFLDAGTTCEAVVDHLAGVTDVTVVTNDLHTAIRAMHQPGLRVIHAGGEADAASASTVGRFAVATVSSISIDVCFLSTAAWDPERGVTSDDTARVDLKRAAMATSTQRFLLGDSSKAGGVERFRVCTLDELDGVVTDDHVSPAIRTATEARTRLRIAPCV